MNRRLLRRSWCSCAVLLVPALAWAATAPTAAAAPTAASSGRSSQKHGAIVAVLASFGFGFVASLTPCVYPMVPITVSIFGATEAKSRLRGAALSGDVRARHRGALHADGRRLGAQRQADGLGALEPVRSSSASRSSSRARRVDVRRVRARAAVGPQQQALDGRRRRLQGRVRHGPRDGPHRGALHRPVPHRHGHRHRDDEERRARLARRSSRSRSASASSSSSPAPSRVNLPKGGAWMMGIKWVSGVGLAYMAFTYLRDRFEPVRNLVAPPELRVRHRRRRRLPRRHRPRRHPHGGRAAQVADRAPLEADEARVDRPGRRRRCDALHQLDSADPRRRPERARDRVDRRTRSRAAPRRPPRTSRCSSTSAPSGARPARSSSTTRSPTPTSAPRRSASSRSTSTRPTTRTPDTKRLKEKYKVVGLPTVIMLDRTGKEVVALQRVRRPRQVRRRDEEGPRKLAPRRDDEVDRSSCHGGRTELSGRGSLNWSRDLSFFEGTSLLACKRMRLRVARPCSALVPPARKSRDRTSRHGGATSAGRATLPGALPGRRASRGRATRRRHASRGAARQAAAPANLEDCDPNWASAPPDVCRLASQGTPEVIRRTGQTDDAPLVDGQIVQLKRPRGAAPTSGSPCG